MNEIYSSIGMSKQNFHQRLNRQLEKEMEKGQLLHLVSKIRKDHPRMSARKMYTMLSPSFIGRDAFERFCFESGYKIEQKRSYRKTTDSRGTHRFPNMLKDPYINALTSILVSDITYYRIAERFYYLTFIMDLCSREILGYHASENLLTSNTTIPSLKMVKKNAPKNSLRGTIFHSDGGGQYYCKDFLEMTNEAGIYNSMGECVYDNPNAERLNGIIKNDYLKPFNPKSFEELEKLLKKSVNLYNIERPHKALGGLTPKQFREKFSTFSELLTKRKKVAKKEKVNYY
jgi:putative transposase